MGSTIRRYFSMSEPVGSSHIVTIDSGSSEIQKLLIKSVDEVKPTRHPNSSNWKFMIKCIICLHRDDIKENIN